MAAPHSTPRRRAWLFGLAALLAAPAASAGALDDRAASWEAQDAATLRRTAPRLAEAAVAVPFDAMDRRVTAYADWIYGWFSGLLTASELAYIGAAEAGREIYDGRTPNPQTVQRRLVDVIERRFEDTVIMPEATTAALIGGWRRTAARLIVLDRRLADERRIRIEREAVRLGVDPWPVLERHGAPLLPSSFGESQPPAGLVYRSMLGPDEVADDTSDALLFRSLRPLAARVVGSATRLLLIPAASSLVTSPMWQAGNVGARLAASMAASAGIWGFDHLVNRPDTRLSRPGFEAALRSAVRDAHLRTAQDIRRHIDAILCRTLAAGCAAATTVAVDRRTG